MNRQTNLIYRPTFKPRWEDDETKELSGLISFETPVKYYQTSKGIVAKCVTLPKQMLQQIKSQAMLRVRKPVRTSIKLKPMTTMNKTELLPFDEKDVGQKHKPNQSQSEIIFDLIKARIANKLSRVRNIRVQLEEQVSNLSKPTEDKPQIGSRGYSKSLHAKKTSKCGYFPTILPSIE